MPLKTGWKLGFAVIIPTVLALPGVAVGATVGNPLCPGEEVLFDLGNGENIIVTAIRAGLRCTSWNPGPFRPADAIMGQPGRRTGFRQPLHPRCRRLRSERENAAHARETDRCDDRECNAFQPGGPAVDIAFEHGSNGGRLFATDNGSNGGRISILDPSRGALTPLITGLPGGPTGRLAFQDGWIYWGPGRRPTLASWSLPEVNPMFHVRM